MFYKITKTEIKMTTKLLKMTKAHNKIAKTKIKTEQM